MGAVMEYTIRTCNEKRVKWKTDFGDLVRGGRGAGV